MTETKPNIRGRRFMDSFISSRLYVALLFTGILLTSCKKDMVLPVEQTSECDCEPIPEIEGPSFGYAHVKDSTYYLWAQFNPNNDDEILYCEYAPGIMNINRLNLKTNEKSLIYNGHVISAPEWGKQNWIIFTLADARVYKIRPDGSELTPITYGGEFFHARFNEDGDKFIAFRAYQDVSEVQTGALWDINGNYLDSLPFASNESDWRKQDLYAARRGESVKLFDVESKTVVKELFLTGPNDFVGDFIWLNSQSAMYTKGGGIHKLNVQTGESELLQCGCSSRAYFDGSVNSSGTMVLYTRSIKTVLQPGLLLDDLGLVLFTTDGEFIRSIEIPE